MSEKLKRKVDQYIKSWKLKGYAEGIPDEAPILLQESGRVPSYKVIAKAILKNDTCLLTLGYSRPSCELYMQIKREELRARGMRVWEARQTKLF